jgi:hypothetical protein
MVIVSIFAHKGVSSNISRIINLTTQKDTTLCSVFCFVEIWKVHNSFKKKNFKSLDENLVNDTFSSD